MVVDVPLNVVMHFTQGRRGQGGHVIGSGSMPVRSRRELNVVENVRGVECPRGVFLVVGERRKGLLLLVIVPALWGRSPAGSCRGFVGRIIQGGESLSGDAFLGRRRRSLRTAFGRCNGQEVSISTASSVSSSQRQAVGCGRLSTLPSNRLEDDVQLLLEAALVRHEERLFARDILGRRPVDLNGHFAHRWHGVLQPLELQVPDRLLRVLAAERDTTGLVLQRILDDQEASSGFGHRNVLEGDHGLGGEGGHHEADGFPVLGHRSSVLQPLGRQTDLRGKERTGRFERILRSLGNRFYLEGVHFRWFFEGQLVEG